MCYHRVQLASYVVTVYQFTMLITTYLCVSSKVSSIYGKDKTVFELSLHIGVAGNTIESFTNGSIFAFHLTEATPINRTGRSDQIRRYKI